MGIFDLLISCTSENVEAFSFGGDNYEWHLRLRCASCQTLTDEIYFTGQDDIDIPNSRGKCNFLMKCKACQQHFNVTLLKSPQFVTLQQKTTNNLVAQFECRGAEPETWNFQQLYVKSTSGTVFEGADLTDTWVDYDEKEHVNCLIENFKAVFQKGK